KVKVGGLPVSTAMLKDIQAGTVGWGVDTQPYLEGYYAVQAAAQYVRYKMAPAAPIMTGSVPITKKNVAAALAAAAAYPGLPGAGVAAIVIYAFFAIETRGNGFTTIAGAANWLNTAAQLGILAVPVGLLMIAGEFVLSIGSMIGASSVTVGIASGAYHAPLAVG